MVIAELIQFISNYITTLISNIGYLGVFFLMTLESALIPIPSEIIMPFSGFLVWKGTFDIILVTLAGTVGNLAGSIIAYFIGVYVGRGLIIKYGKFVLIREHHLELTEKWFKKYGDRMVFFSRMLPAVRTYISLPAGIAKMNFKKFCIYTFVGSIPWNFALTYIGFWLGNRWETILTYTHELDLAVIIGVIVVVIWFVFKKKMK